MIPEPPDAAALRVALRRLIVVVERQLVGDTSPFRVWTVLNDGLRLLEPMVAPFRRAEAEKWLARMERTMTRKPRITSGVYRRAAAGDPEACRLIAEREAEYAAYERRIASRGGR